MVFTTSDLITTPEKYDDPAGYEVKKGGDDGEDDDGENGHKRHGPIESILDSFAKRSDLIHRLLHRQTNILGKH